MNCPEGAVKTIMTYKSIININRPEGAVKNHQHLKINNKCESPRRSGKK
jgi:hypothetical protein